MEKKKVFLAWSGDTGRKFAEALKETLLTHPSLDPWISSQDIRAGAPWFEYIKNALDGSDYGLACLSAGASAMPWINFEAGYLFGSLRNFKLLLFEESLHGPLAHLHSVHGARDEDVVKLLDELVGESSQEWFDFKEAEWKERVRKIEVDETSHLELAIQSFVSAGLRLRENSSLATNGCFRRILVHSIRLNAQRVDAIRSHYSIPAERYPHYLIELQEEFLANVSALAIVRHQEQFWQQDVGRHVLRTSARGRTRRVFAFWSPEHLLEHYDILLQHAETYDTWLISYNKLTQEFPGYAQDFSVITVDGDAVLAQYEQLGTTRSIRFSVEQKSIDQHLSVLERIIKRSAILRTPMAAEKLVERVFGRAALAPIETRPVEMSEYISPHDYHEHEEDHAYYREMVETMIATWKAHWRTRGDGDMPWLLELGAGTGLFTKRLLELQFGHLAALELDWACFSVLKGCVARAGRAEDRDRVELLNEDSRSFDPDGKFDAIFSCFADHHIKKSDKGRYFENVKVNMKPGALMIVGDEFLPEHDPADRHRALEAYHGHIIELARAAGNDVLVGLETAALKSGLEELGDFKVSCSEYEALLRGAGLHFDKKKIGPLDTDEVGGVYVYQVWA